MRGADKLAGRVVECAQAEELKESKRVLPPVERTEKLTRLFKFSVKKRLTGSRLHKKASKNTKTLSNTSFGANKNQFVGKTAFNGNYQDIRPWVPTSKLVEVKYHHRKFNSNCIHPNGAIFTSEASHCLATIDNAKRLYRRRGERSSSCIRKKVNPLQQPDYEAKLGKIRSNMEQSFKYLKTREELYKEQMNRMHRLETVSYTHLTLPTNYSV
eukprot:TRINITY_DN4425_c0_g1_i1.p1 TRINITY_DN4425_c0_g1~~TRINITY_DN4425_c0_g1_i1.p1  ORF type:complete len:213 (-),score=35.54 TRINITY_DN4425_c0_g1_i1:46-684(-)